MLVTNAWSMKMSKVRLDMMDFFLWIWGVPSHSPDFCIGSESYANSHGIVFSLLLIVEHHARAVNKLSNLMGNILIATVSKTFSKNWWDVSFAWRFVVDGKISWINRDCWSCEFRSSIACRFFWFCLFRLMKKSFRDWWFDKFNLYLLLLKIYFKVK